MNDYLKIAIGQLDWLDPILGIDIQFACHGIVNMSALSIIYEECLARASVHPSGTLREAWNNVLDALEGAMGSLNSHV